MSFNVYMTQDVVISECYKKGQFYDCLILNDGNPCSWNDGTCFFSETNPWLSYTAITVAADDLGAFLLTWINLNPNMDK